MKKIRRERKEHLTRAEKKLLAADLLKYRNALLGFRVEEGSWLKWDDVMQRNSRDWRWRGHVHSVG